MVPKITAVIVTLILLPFSFAVTPDRVQAIEPIDAIPNAVGEYPSIQSPSCYSSHADCNLKCKGGKAKCGWVGNRICCH